MKSKPHLKFLDVCYLAEYWSTFKLRLAKCLQKETCDVPNGVEKEKKKKTGSHKMYPVQLW